MLDPRFKKLVFKHDSMLSQAARRTALRWLTDEFNTHYKGKVHKPKDDSDDDEDDADKAVSPGKHQTASFEASQGIGGRLLFQLRQ